ncbi:hypothetical protein JAAARDRAFT_174306 [Jaapia argillacea MUCL 33604]|uniref:Mitochondrial carrier n=1 Tax=Jaapia argillacea MUCL 33604 TaxID=933084 RepID=A0A067QCE6_9AGAM|nr:hypothetical protein JAAARDRAFT_174306 [Jaapia argillacea MUCL 33604]
MSLSDAALPITSPHPPSSHPSLPFLDTPFGRALKDIAFGSTAGIASKFFEHPFDLCKVRLQAQVLDEKARFSGPIDCLEQTWRKEGVRGLYRGLPAPIVGAMAENASLFLSYRELQNLIRTFRHNSTQVDLSLPELALAGAGAGAITSFILTPIELIKCKMQVQMLISPSLSASPTIPHNLPGPITLLTSIIRQTGIRGLWLGQTGTFIRETGGGAAWFATKEAFARGLIALNPGEATSSPGTSDDGIEKKKRRDLAAWESALSGAFAGGMYNLALFPADTVKSTIQTEEELRPRGQITSSSTSRRPTFFGTFVELYRKQGLKGLYAGCGITVARSIPSSAIIFLIYDGLSRRFG